MEQRHREIYFFKDAVCVSGYRLASYGRKQEDNEEPSMWKVAIMAYFDGVYYLDIRMEWLRKIANFLARIVSLLAHIRTRDFIIKNQERWHARRQVRIQLKACMSPVSIRLLLSFADVRLVHFAYSC